MTKLSTIEKQRYHRHLILEEIGEKGQEKLKASRVLIVGAGGLGCPAIQYLTAAGVGQLTIMDDDTVDVSNLQRQVFYGTKDIGKHKAIVASALMSIMNKQVSVDKLVIRASYKNACSIIRNFDLVLDCTDNLKARYVLNDACILEDKPLVHASVYKTQGQMSVFNYQGGPSYRCLFPEPDDLNNDNRAVLGIYSIPPGIFGLLQANEALKIIMGIGRVQSGKLLIFNTFNQKFHQLKIKRKPEHFDKEKLIKHFS
ncbi:MAG: HesA/MoeB/ThiF family protein [Bacteroidales bacterium]|nr:HesA/MoeB/ThiF family protein [Bacteroidales bacterium]